MKKIFVLSIVLLIFTCGCSVNYNIFIDGDNINESTTITSRGNENITKEYLYELYKEEKPIYYDQHFTYYDPYSKIDDYTYYEKSIKENEYGYIVNLKANYSLQDYNRSRILNDSLSNVDIYYDNNDKTYNYYLDDFKIFAGENYINNIVVQITTSPKIEVVSSNADSTKDNIYTWNISNRYRSVVFKYRIIKDNRETIIEPKEDDNKNSNILIILLVAFLGILILFILFRIFKGKKGTY